MLHNNNNSIQLHFILKYMAYASLRLIAYDHTWLICNINSWCTSNAAKLPRQNSVL